MKLSRVQLYLSEAWVFIKRRLCSIYEAGWCSLPSQRQHRHGVKVEAAKHVGAPCCFFSRCFPAYFFGFFEDDYDFVWVSGWLRNVGFCYLKVIPLGGSCVSRVVASVFSPRLSGTEIFEVKTGAGDFWSHVELKRSLLTDDDNSYKKRDTA